MAAATLPCSSSLTPLPASSSPSPSPSQQQQQALFLLKIFRVRPLSPHRLPRPLLPVYFNLRRRPAASTRCSSSSYNGWADLAADPDPDLPFALPLQLPQSHALLPLLLLLVPVAALSLSLSLSRLPPIPLLAAAFAAGFAARHLAPASPSSSQSHRLADLDAQVRAFKDQLASAGAGAGADTGLLLDAVDRVRDAVVDAARLASQGGNTTTTTASDALPPVLGDVAKGVARYFGGWARETMRELSFSSPRKKPKDKSNSDAAVLDKGNKDAIAAAGAQSQQEDADKLLDSPIHAGTKPSIAKDSSLDSAVIGTGTARAALDMLPFDKDVNGLDDAGFVAQSTQEDGRLERLVFKHRYGRDGVRNDPFQGGSFATESMESSLLERTLEIRDMSYRLKIERRGGEGQASEAQERPADHFVGNAASFDPTHDESAATDSDGEEFSRNFKEAAEILWKARECMMARADEETADALLYKSARLLSTAVALRPTSLVAVGQLGNTHLLHGELKLKISRELRTLLSNSGAYLNGRERVSRSRKLDRRILSRDNISSALVGVCEECESLLVEAGRSYRMALSIDSGDVKALYNWGLALIFRAQLLADIGPEAAVDADRVYLAAIDKFDAMLSKSNSYAPEALYRWGTALQQRSHLRSGSSKEKIRLLEQAKSLFEDVLYVEAGNKMVREALSSCISELSYHGRWL